MATVAMREMQASTPSAAGRILIADDQRHILDALHLLLKGSGFSTELVTDPQRVLTALQAGSFDAVLIDLNYTRDTTGGGEGLELVSQIRAIDKLVPIIVMTAWSSVDLAVEAMRSGASDFVQKPWDNWQLLQKLQHHVSRGQARQRTQRARTNELQEAREIQEKLLPKKLPEIAGYEVAGITQPLRFVGGDYYNIVRVGPQHTALCIADVAGKGMPAALLMSSLQAALTPLISQNLAPRELCHRLNRILCDVTPAAKFISFFYAVLNNQENRLVYCNAGHNPPLLIRADGHLEELNAQGAVLGQFPNWSYQQSEIGMRSGDRLVIFTDGLIETSDANEKPFGEENLIRIARENRGFRAADLMAELMRGASQQCSGHFQDDASLIVLKAV
jgi:serine phosphatase RsbU (regulator of sigma subunit)